MDTPFNSPAPAVYTQDGGNGFRFDFNDGARVSLPPGSWHVQIIDADSSLVMFECESKGGWVCSSKKYYVKYAIKITDNNTGDIAFEYTMDLKDKPVLIKFPIGTLGDLIAWIPYADKFQKKHKCILECSVGEDIKELFKNQYKNIVFSCPPKSPKTKEPYASYKVGIFFGSNRFDYCPYDYRQLGLQKIAAYILGVDASETKPKMPVRGKKTDIKEKYVCIATKSTMQCKFWNREDGWRKVVEYLKSKGYRVLCIDRDRRFGKDDVWNEFIDGAEDFTGNKPLSERVSLLRRADFFIGLSSGLSWLAWATGCPVVMIAGFTLPTTEFYTPYRVTNPRVCNGCWDDTNISFDSQYFWCPRNKGYECTKEITPDSVISAIERLQADKIRKRYEYPGG